MGSKVGEVLGLSLVEEEHSTLIHSDSIMF